jgi:hypothetical protein
MRSVKACQEIRRGRTLSLKAGRNAQVKMRERQWDGPCFHFVFESILPGVLDDPSSYNHDLRCKVKVETRPPFSRFHILLKEARICLRDVF